MTTENEKAGGEVLVEDTVNGTILQEAKKDFEQAAIQDLRRQEMWNLQNNLINASNQIKSLESDNKELARDLEGYKILYRSTETERRLLEDKIKTMKTVINAL